MLYTRKGDKGTTKTFGCDQRISKSSAIAEALGTMDELNSFLGLARACLKGDKKNNFKLGRQAFSEIVFTVQQNLFIIQAELAGAGKTIHKEKVKEAEEIINAAEKNMPPIKSFFISGASEIGAMFDFARALSRRAERRVVEVAEEEKVEIGEYTLAYLNRLSSLLYVLARFSNHKSGAKEKAPEYK